MIKSRLQWWPKTSDLFPSSQASFRPGRSCADNLTMLTMSVKEAFSMGKDVLACFLVKGAFDNVNSDILMKKFSTMECPHNIVNLVNFLTHERNVTFVVNDSYIFIRKVFKGLSQGGVLSPLLYLIYVNDIIVSLNPFIQISQFANDIAIYCPVTIPSKSKRTLEKTITILGANFDHLGLSLALEKTILIHFNQKEIRPVA
ncbi:uncharacterized protein LOC122530817 [Frieseomelitta varia]|uniref:uncharacterized protein LOC122530817 n=1 Tax=Frieseomelitta varia TaxID=561572 RepID=UPI001CB691B2|nr:uncharacterized protein LOC122530817 [Frieseomelitta varia]